MNKRINRRNFLKAGVFSMAGLTPLIASQSAKAFENVKYAIHSQSIKDDNILPVSGIEFGNIEYQIERYLMQFHPTIRLHTYKKKNSKNQDDSLTLVSPQYALFLKETLLGAHKELRDHLSDVELTQYAAYQLDLKPDHNTKWVDENITADSISNKPGYMNSKFDNNRQVDAQDLNTLTYNRVSAISYANLYAYACNTQYPYFTDNDCTNFVSQCVFTGGVPQSGDGTCRNEETSKEWYVKSVPQCGLPGQKYRTWAWSNAWSRVDAFRYYMRDEKKLYVEAYPANNESISLLIDRVRPGDIVQFDVLVQDIFSRWWNPTHGAIIVQKTNKGGYYKNDALFKEHTGLGKEGLRGFYNFWVNQKLEKTRRMVWIKMP